MINKVFCRKMDWGDSIEVYLGDFPIRGNGSMVVNLEFEEIKDGEALNASPLVFRTDTAQALMDGLWDCGLRPSEGFGSAGALAATQAHLMDMRETSAKLLNMIEKKWAK